MILQNTDNLRPPMLCENYMNIILKRGGGEGSIQAQGQQPRLYHQAKNNIGHKDNAQDSTIKLKTI